MHSGNCQREHGPVAHRLVKDADALPSARRYLNPRGDNDHSPQAAQTPAHGNIFHEPHRREAADALEHGPSEKHSLISVNQPGQANASRGNAIHPAKCDAVSFDVHAKATCRDSRPPEAFLDLAERAFFERTVGMQEKQYVTACSGGACVHLACSAAGRLQK
jgi:hypothetical protein